MERNLGKLEPWPGEVRIYVNWFVPPPVQEPVVPWQLSPPSPQNDRKMENLNRDHAELVEPWSRGAGPCGYTTVDLFLVCWVLAGSVDFIATCVTEAGAMVDCLRGRRSEPRETPFSPALTPPTTGGRIHLEMPHPPASRRAEG